MIVSTQQEKKSFHSKEPNVEAKVIEAFLRPFFEKSDTQTLISYDEISKHLGRDIRRNRQPLYRVMKRLGKEFRRSMTTVIGEGIRVSDSVDQVFKSERDVKIIGRKTRNAHLQSQWVNLEELDEHKKRQIISLQTQFGTIAAVASASATKKIEAAVKTNNSELPPMKMLKAFVE